jgi:hypothetical protein
MTASVQSRTVRALAAFTGLALRLSSSTSAVAADAVKRPVPDYEGRPAAPPSVGDVLLWVPRVVFSPVYFTTEFLLRRPIGAAVTAAERANLPRVLYNFFAFGPDHKAGVAPVAFVDFGVNPSIGAYAFWDDAFFKGDDLRAHVSGWPSEWLGGSAVQHVRFGDGDALTVRVEGIRRPDFPFYGLGPRTLETQRSRYGSDRVGASVAVAFPYWRASKVEAAVRTTYANFYDGHYGGDPGIVEESKAGGAYALPEGFASGYAAVASRLGLSIDSRQPFPNDGSGVRLEGAAEQGGAFGAFSPSEWIHYGGGAAGFVDLDGHRRTVSLSAQTTFVDPVGGGAVPFTELATLGGDKAPMPGFLPGRMIDRSAAVATLRYRWPIGPWLDGSLQAAVGNVFGEHLEDFDTRLLRVSAALGFESDSSPDSAFHFLIGFGTETFEQGGKIDSFRLALGTDTGL